MKVKGIMQNVIKISSNSTISEAARVLDKKDIGSVLVEEGSKIIGVVTQKDILQKVIVKGKHPNSMKTKDIVSKTIVKIDSNEDLLEASRLLNKHRIGKLMVTKEGKIIGEVTEDNVNRNIKYKLLKGSPDYTRQWH
jgi:CBS domain-containing protein|tara:strand:+ start:1410 stop:1820 length:411 start_codon:yes stop_codon:yes gene_type:complete